MSRRFVNKLPRLSFSLLQTSSIQAEKGETRSQLHIDFGVPFMYSVLEVRHIFWSPKAHVAFHFAAAVLFLRLILHLNLLKNQDFQSGSNFLESGLFQKTNGLTVVTAPTLVVI